MGTVHEVGLVWDEMQRHLFDLVNGVQDAREIRSRAFAQTEVLSKDLTRLLKGQEFLPRFVLLGLRNASSALENGAEFLPDPRPVLEMANSLKWTLDLILMAESHSDRQAGIPRIS